jgi:hypothetical protein
VVVAVNELAAVISRPSAAASTQASKLSSSLSSRVSLLKQVKRMGMNWAALPSRLQDLAARHLAEELNATETVFPGADQRLIFTLHAPP